MKIKITYIVIAKSIPEFSKRNNSAFTCTIGFCPEFNKLIRVYPIPLKGMNRWEKYRIEVEKNKLDSREESWKLSSYAKYEDWVGLDKDVQYIETVKRNNAVPYLLNFKCQNLKYLNEQKKSIGIVPINKYRLYWESNERQKNTTQLSLFKDVDEEVELADFTKYTKDTMNYEPRIYFTGTDGEHDLMYNDWGVCMWYKKFAGEYPMEDAFRHLKMKNYALLGNLNYHRNSWICLDLY